MKKTIADNMIVIMKRDNVNTVWYGDLPRIHECAELSKMKEGHPLNIINRVLNALDRSTFFQKGYIYSDHTGRNIKYRSFKLKR